MEEQKHAHPADSKLPKTKIVLFALLAVVLVLSAGGGVYYWQHKELNQVRAQLAKSSQNNNALKSKVGALNKHVSSLESQLTQSKSQTQSTGVSVTQSTPTASDSLTIKVLDSYRYYTTKYPNNPYIVVDMTLTNASSSSLLISASSFSLRDSSGNGGGSFGELSGTTMPNGNTILGDQTLAPGQTVTGGITFGAFNKNATAYTLSYKSQTFSVDADTSVNEQ